MPFTNGSASNHRPAAHTPLIGGQYGSPTAQAFAPSPPQQYGVSQPIPSNKVGITAQRSFTKINRQLTPGPIAKIVLKIQQSRF